MTDTKHTRGPWLVKALSQAMKITGNMHQVTDIKGYPSAFIPAWDVPEGDDVDSSLEAICNANLIAAAPDLLEALKDMLLDYGASHKSGIAAMKAIAKAKGEPK